MVVIDIEIDSVVYIDYLIVIFVNFVFVRISYKNFVINNRY